MRTYNLTAGDRFFRKINASQKSNAKFITKAILEIRKCNGYETDLGKDLSLDHPHLELNESCNVVSSYPILEILTTDQDTPTKLATIRNVVAQIACTAENYQETCNSVIRDITKAFDSVNPPTPKSVFQHVIDIDCYTACVEEKNKIGVRLCFTVQTNFKYKEIGNDCA